jgi:SAM-dependent methyltransferase
VDARPLEDDASLTNEGERMVVGNMWGYWAHLSIYRFALPFVEGKRVLEAGTGSGYGTAYLSRHGAKVLGFDHSDVAVEHSRRRYAGDPVTFEVADLNKPLPIGDRMFDVVFSSNVFEHVGRVDALTQECARAVKEDGVVIIAVPPITSADVLVADMRNQFHVNHIPPSAWRSKFKRFFWDVRYHAHVATGEFASAEQNQRELQLPPDQVTIRETDFDFPAIDGDDIDSRETITAVFVCRKPRKANEYLPETIAERTPAEWCEGEKSASLLAEERKRNADLSAAITSAEAKASAARCEGEKTARLLTEERKRNADLLAAIASAQAKASQLLATVADVVSANANLKASTSWRLLAPVRSLVETVRSYRHRLALWTASRRNIGP